MTLYKKYTYNGYWYGYEYLLEKMLIDNNLTNLINNKKCLDVGTRDGKNCSMIIKYNANLVIGIDIDDSKFNEIEQNENIKLIKQDFFELNDDKFDIITFFLWNMSYKDYDKTVEKIKRLLNINGIVIISAVDSVYRSKTDSLSIEQLFNKYFDDIFIIDNKYLKLFIIK